MPLLTDQNGIIPSSELEYVSVSTANENVCICNICLTFHGTGAVMWTDTLECREVIFESEFNILNVLQIYYKICFNNVWY